MTQKLRYITFETAAGWIGALSSANGLLSITLPRRSAPQALRSLGKRAHDAILAPEIFHDLAARLQTYFSRQQVDFSDILDLSSATTFQQRVWKVTRLIPYGKTQTYGWIAQQLGNPAASRAVGQALGANPLPIIIPCHRVLASNGRLGGFSGGLKTKKQLLKLEGIDGIK
ncbi:MAG: methylated-DNA--[protein]-cysteine S-methyltransferase [Dehalococcoidales bacterium]|nr:methylated-DNA--[protein]-cysteine S-methyltransferase [Dehalococcoidales bacterium]